MNTQILDIEVRPGQTLTINFVSPSRKNKKTAHAPKDDEGNFTLIDKRGNEMQRLTDLHISQLLSGKRTAFTKEASDRIGGVMGLTLRLSTALSNLKSSRKLGKARYGVSLNGNIPNLKDFDIFEDADGRVIAQSRF